MDLKVYLVRNNITVNDFSEKIGCSRVYLSHIITGHQKPSKRLAKDISSATNGEVSIEYLLTFKEKMK